MAVSLGTGVLIGPYEVLAQLGAGGMGVVHLAKTATASLVALKVIKAELAGDAQMRQRFMDEVDSLRMVYGARIARFEGADLDHDPPWLAIQYVPGPTLREHVEQRGTIPSELGPILGAVLAEGLVAIHKAGLVHRDLKPHNVIMAEDGPIIIDLGLAQLTDRGDHLTETGAAVGTPAYMPPEQVRGEKVDGKADVYALGATLVFALTGHHLYTADNRYAMAQQIVDPATHPDLSGIPGTLAGLVGSMVAQDSAQRPSAAQAMDAFVNVLRGAGQDATAVRTQLAAATFVRPVLLLSDDVNDPLLDPEDPYAIDLGDGPTELVTGPRPAEPKTTPAPPRARQPVNVDWLVASLRDRYAKGDRTVSAFPPGTRILARDEEWLVRSAKLISKSGQPEVHAILAIGVTEFVQGVEATFFTDLDLDIVVLKPEDTKLVADDSPRFRRGRLFLEAVLRRTPLPRSERGLALVDKFLVDPMTYQQRPAELALRGERPGLLIADVVGLGKTIEIGLLLAELIRRGRGERILVVTPQHILEQFQHEMWTRFSIPLVRLDSVGIERIQREIPAGRNPFTYFKRAIISIDTLKNVVRYGHHLEATKWDAVVIDESHNLLGETSQRSKLARRLAEYSDALIFASATPHAGELGPFLGLARMLDPTVSSDEKAFQPKDIEHLYIRRTKIDPEVREQIGHRWADREDPVPVYCEAGPAEEAVFAELTRTWLSPAEEASRKRGRAEGLFAYTLLKAHLSSPAALAETITNRLKSDKMPAGERADLLRLQGLNESITDSAKLTAFVEQLSIAGIGPDSDTRVVVFSERIKTLEWLAEVVPPQLKLKTGQTKVLHRGIGDTELQHVVEQFALKGTGFTGQRVLNPLRQLHRKVVDGDHP